MNIAAPRRVTSEERVRSSVRNGTRYRISVRWHFLDDGTKYHYVHVYINSLDLPVRWWRWVTTADDQFIEWA